MRKLLISTLLLTVLTRTTLADCRKDCQDVIQLAKAALAAKDVQILAQQNAIDDLQKSLAASDAAVASDDRELSRWYRNPVLVATLSILAGGLATLYLEKK